MLDDARTIIGIQIRRLETPFEVSQIFKNTAEALGVKGLQVELAGLVHVGTTTFARFHTNALDVDPILSRILCTKKRAVIRPVRSSYAVKYKAEMPDGRTGNVPTSNMTAGCH